MDPNGFYGFYGFYGFCGFYGFDGFSGYYGLSGIHGFYGLFWFDDPIENPTAVPRKGALHGVASKVANTPEK